MRVLYSGRRSESNADGGTVVRRSAEKVVENLSFRSVGAMGGQAEGPRGAHLLTPH